MYHRFIHISLWVDKSASWLLVGYCTAVISGCCNGRRTRRHWSESDQKYGALIGRHFLSVILLAVRGARGVHICWDTTSWQRRNTQQSVYGSLPPDLDEFMSPVAILRPLTCVFINHIYLTDPAAVYIYSPVCTTDPEGNHLYTHFKLLLHSYIIHTALYMHMQLI